ncbi:MAG TPA: sulfotransferase [Tepidisphaeraceae bacterium]|nr:sulfotransferase [Tepidisphaeraceae bacterium]
MRAEGPGRRRGDSRIAAGEGPKLPEPAVEIVIILAPPRSFTTVLSAMLGQHPQLYGIPETYFFTSDSVDEWVTLYRGTDHMNGALRAIAEIIFGQQSRPTINLARQWLQARSLLTTSDVLRLLGQRVAPAVLVEKTPAASEQLESMQRMLREFPSARFLHLTRHPHAQVRSRLERRLRPGEADGPASLTAAAQILGGHPEGLWLRTHTTILRFLQEVPREQQFRARGEEVLAAPDEALPRIADWLGIRSDDEAIDAMKHPERSLFAHAGPPNARRGGDEKFFDEPTLRAYVGDEPRLDLPVPWCPAGGALDKDVRELATSFGYE